MSTEVVSSDKSNVYFKAEESALVFISYGLQEHLLYAAAQAKRLAPRSSRVIVLTDTPFNIEGIEVHQIEPYSAGSKEFAPYYKHQSINPAWIELACISRWYVLRDFMKAQALNSVVYLDSDVLLYCDFFGAFSRFRNYSFGLSKISAHTSFFSLKVLEDICEVFLRYYKDGDPHVVEFIEKHRSGGILTPESVCDMTFLDYFKNNTNHSQLDLFQIIKDSDSSYFFDHNFNVGDLGFEMDGKNKKIFWQDGAPYARLIQSDELIRLKSIHYQGSAKPLIKEHFNMTGQASCLP